jgi:hypothetical protein
LENELLLESNDFNPESDWFLKVFVITARLAIIDHYYTLESVEVNDSIQDSHLFIFVVLELFVSDHAKFLGVIDVT